MKRAILLIYWLLASVMTFAQGPPILTGTPVMLGLDGSGVRTFGKFIAKENATIYVQPVGIPYNITSKFQVGGIFPFKSVNPKEGASGNGLADMAVFAKYQLYKKDGVAKTFRILASVKQSFPTGQTSRRPQIGSGLYQTYVGLILGRVASSFGIYGDIGYNITSDVASDNFIYNFSMVIPLLPQKYPQKQINASLEWNGNYIFDPKIHQVFISPGLQFIPGRRILFETSFQIPIIQNNILTNKTKYMILLGTRFLIR